MRTTFTIDDDLLAKATKLAGPSMERSALLNEGLKAFIQRESAKRLAKLGGTQTQLVVPPRRRQKASS